MSAKAKILVVDDDDDYRASTRALLESEGYEVLEAASGHDGLITARTGSPDLIVLDIMMESPVEGYSVVHALKFRDEGRKLDPIPVVMVSSVKQDPATLFPLAGELDMVTPDAYFTKPLEIAPFLKCVQRMLGK